MSGPVNKSSLRYAHTVKAHIGISLEARKEGDPERLGRYMKAAIYCRVSTEDQEREGTSLQSQLDACLKLAREKGFQVEAQHIVQEVYSGLTLERPDLTKLRGWLHSDEVQAVVIYDSDRFSRDGYDFVTLIRDCERANASLLCVSEPIEHGPIGELLSYVRGWASRREAEKIKERTSRGRKARIASGKLANGKASYLYGYRYIPSEGKRQIDPDTSRIVQDIFRWFTEEGLPIDHIIYKLRDSRIPSPTGKRMWARATVWAMLKRPAYIGDTFTPSIIEQEKYDRAQARLRYNKEMARRNVKREYLLRGHLFCKHCSRRYQGAVKRYKTLEGIKEYQYYRCSAAHRIYAEPCHNPAWKAEELDNLIWREVESILSNPQVIMNGIESIKDDGGILQQELARCEQRLIDIDNQQEQLLQWALKGFPEQTVSKENKRLNQDRLDLLQHKTEIESRLREVRESQVRLEDIQQAFGIVKTNLGKLSFQEKRMALSALGVKVRVDKGNVLVEGSIPIGAIASTPSNRNGERMPSTSACQPTQAGQSMPLD